MENEVNFTGNKLNQTDNINCSSKQRLGFITVVFNRHNIDLDLMDQLPVQVVPQLFTWRSTIFTISGEVGQRETLKTTCKSYDLEYI